MCFIKIIKRNFERCKPGVTGRQCNECAAQHYGFSVDGCKPCDCDLTGSETMNCDPLTGQCLCKTNVEGLKNFIIINRLKFESKLMNNVYFSFAKFK